MNALHVRVLRFIAVMNKIPQNRELYRYGQCYGFFEILKEIFPVAEAHYSEEEGHVYAKIGGRFYDIDGCRVTTPEDLEELSLTRDKPHLWGAKDRRVLR